MKIVKEEKKNWFLKILEAICKLFKTSNKKFVIKSKCKENCCCKNCSCIAALDEKSEDDSEEDIVITNNNIVIKWFLLFIIHLREW